MQGSKENICFSRAINSGESRPQVLMRPFLLRLPNELPAETPSPYVLFFQCCYALLNDSASSNLA